MKRLMVLVLVTIMWPVITWAASPYTPRPGSVERKAVSDAMRSYIKAYRAPKPVLFKIEQMNVLGNYCYFKGHAVYADGSGIPDGYLPDVVYSTFLKRGQRGWRVILDLTRTDVPSEREIADIRRRFPAEIPRQIVPRFWRELLRL